MIDCSAASVVVQTSQKTDFLSLGLREAAINLNTLRHILEFLMEEYT